MDLSKRSPEEVVKAHVEALNQRDLAAIMRDYGEDAYLISADAVQKGRTAIEQVFAGVLPMGLNFETDELVAEGDLVLLQWNARSASVSLVGVDTFLVRDGLIVGQTVKAAPEGS